MVPYTFITKGKYLCIIVIGYLLKHRVLLLKSNKYEIISRQPAIKLHNKSWLWEWNDKLSTIV